MGRKTWNLVRLNQIITKQRYKTTKLANPKDGYEIFLFTDTRDKHLAAILSQLPSEQRQNSIEEEEKEPLCFLSGSLTVSSENWIVPEKEGFTIF